MRLFCLSVRSRGAARVHELSDRVHDAVGQVRIVGGRFHGLGVPANNVMALPDRAMTWFPRVKARSSPAFTRIWRAQKVAWPGQGVA